ncbi:hypothetical protein COT62_03655 [Candidatus Roizmanbacteria bacterium CG09_land_8_20_14_0_10_41_9]|uniref:Glycosyltransferase 2-like domain-containing protein n=1 Tax=Candidatus Roizmanbacteria bacterium CG09_land_8_20_14_0_10_41_9 TaxID=1974850 RepID=A0A2H0WS49_9BACT|nr:MAG: hypothetical protein COT62_03655 [Candidatus Roizmanbacteria bacterium CG09_land_8_20_14_0_10_41_9]
MLAFIIVTYKTPRSEVARLKREIASIGFQNYKVYVIDNSTNNRGFAAGMNEGIQKGLRDEADLFINISPDISFKNLTEKRIQEVTARFDIAGFAMRQEGMIYYGGEIDKWRMSGGLIRKKPKKRFAEVDFASGPFMMIKRKVIEKIGLWDESYFMYYEDVDFCYRARRAGFTVGTDTGYIFDHFEISKNNPEKEKWLAKNRWKFFWRYGNWKQKVHEILRFPKTLKERTII